MSGFIIKIRSDNYFKGLKFKKKFFFYAKEQSNLTFEYYNLQEMT